MAKLSRHRGPGHILEGGTEEALRENMLSLKWVLCKWCGRPLLRYYRHRDIQQPGCGAFGLDQEDCDRCTALRFQEIGSGHFQKIQLVSTPIVAAPGRMWLHAQWALEAEELASEISVTTCYARPKRDRGQRRRAKRPTLA